MISFLFRASVTLSQLNAGANRRENLIIRAQLHFWNVLKTIFICRSALLVYWAKLGCVTQLLSHTWKFQWGKLGLSLFQSLHENHCFMCRNQWVLIFSHSKNRTLHHSWKLCEKSLFQTQTPILFLFTCMCPIFLKIMLPSLYFRENCNGNSLRC